MSNNPMYLGRTVQPRQMLPAENKYARRNIMDDAQSYANQQETVITSNIENNVAIAQMIKNIEAGLPMLSVEKVLLSTLSSNDILKYSIGEIKTGSGSGFGCVNDPRMGTVDPSILCATCCKSMHECPGHFGHVNLQVPVLNPLFTPIILNVLRSVCKSCSRLLASEAQIQQYAKNSRGAGRLKMIASISPEVCSNVNPSFANVTSCGLRPAYTKPTKKPTDQAYTELKNMIKCTYKKTASSDGSISFLSASDVFTIFNQISDKDAEILGFINGAHPRDLVINHFIILPPRIRPNTIEDGKFIVDPLTHAYSDIITSNRALSMGKSAVDRKQAENTLASKVIHIINNSDGKYKPGGSSIVFKGLVQLIQGKDAILRELAMGKRSDYVARSVIGPDSTIKFGQVSIPRVMAKFLTKPVTVTSVNIEEMKKLLSGGKITHVTPKVGNYRGKRIIARHTYDLRVGDIVDRHLMDGDYVLFGRQPSLHRYSMMGHEVVLRPSNITTIGVHPSTCPPLHADFDGDEANVCMPQTLSAQLELEYIASFKNNIISTSCSAPVTGIANDSLIGLYLLTKGNEVSYSVNNVRNQLKILSTDSTSDLAMWINSVSQNNEYITSDVILDTSFIFNMYEYLSDVMPYTTFRTLCIEKNIHPHSGRALISLVLPRDFCYYKKLSDETEVIIRDGFLISGYINGDTVGVRKPNSILHSVWQNYEDSVAGTLITNLTVIGERYATAHGVSIGISDCLISDEAKKKIQAHIRSSKNVIEDIENEACVDPIFLALKERKVLDVIGKLVTEVSKITASEISDDNRFRIMYNSGISKSDMNAVTKIVSMVGQQFLYNERVGSSQQIGNSLPWYPQGDNQPEARGLCTTSFFDGLTPPGYMCQAVTGRSSLIDMAINTSGTGAAQRRLIKGTEDLVVCHDGTVRNGTGKIIQFVYGGDGLSTERTSRVKSGNRAYETPFNINQIVMSVNNKYK